MERKMSAKISKFERSNLKELRVAIDAALAKVGAEYGIDIVVGNISFTSEKFTTKLTSTIRNPAVTAAINNGESVAAAKVNAFARKMGIPNDVFGKTINVNGSEFVVVDAKESRWKFPFTVQGQRGGRYKMTVEQVKRGLL
jgi:hypothetical protein